VERASAAAEAQGVGRPSWLSRYSAILRILSSNLYLTPDAGDDMINRLGATRIGVWAIKHVISPLQRWIYRGTGGRIGSAVGSGQNVLLLTTKGRRTGQDRTTPVFYLRDGDSIVICNVNPGFERTNPWVINLRANRVAQLQIGRDIGQYQAREATDAEITRLWPRLIELWPAYQVHYQRSGRRAISILERAELG
jgi:F420H(2)-dependent quinone reductase